MPACQPVCVPVGTAFPWPFQSQTNGHIRAHTNQQRDRHRHPVSGGEIVEAPQLHRIVPELPLSLSASRRVSSLSAMSSTSRRQRRDGGDIIVKTVHTQNAYGAMVDMCTFTAIIDDFEHADNFLLAICSNPHRFEQTAYYAVFSTIVI